MGGVSDVLELADRASAKVRDIILSQRGFKQPFVIPEQRVMFALSDVYPWMVFCTMELMRFIEQESETAANKEEAARFRQGVQEEFANRYRSAFDKISAGVGRSGQEMLYKDERQARTLDNPLASFKEQGDESPIKTILDSHDRLADQLATTLFGPNASEDTRKLVYIALGYGLGAYHTKLGLPNVYEGLE